MATPHPSKSELSDFILGKLPAKTCDDVASHIDVCPSCQETIRGLDSASDSLISGLRSTPPAAEKDPEYKRVVEKAAALSSASPAPSPSARPAPVSLDQFNQALVDCGLMSDEEIRDFVNALPADKRPRDSEAFAKELVKAGKLTRFQALNLCQGKAKNLVMGEYLVLDKIGAGGMGQVFKAQHRRMQRIVALKVLPPASMKTPDAVKRFQRETQAAARLMHPNIVTAFDAGQSGGLHFLVMEFVDGQDLSALTKQGPLSVEKALDYIVQAARGLAFAHSKGIVHRDIKPGNLLVDKEGVVKILDMGLARLDDVDQAADHQLTNTGAVMGTIDYMAPEQALNTHLADARSDIYSLGCALYRLLTGKSTYGGTTVVEKILAHREQPIPSLHAARPEISAALDGIFAKMLAKKPDGRYQSMNEAIADLESFRTHGATSPSMNPGESIPGASAPIPVAAPLPVSKPQPVPIPQPMPLQQPAPAPYQPQMVAPVPMIAQPYPAPAAAENLRIQTRRTPAQPKSQPRMRRPVALGLIGLGLVAIIGIIAGVVVKLQTSEGTLVVEVNEPDAQVEVLNDQDEVLVTRPAGQGKITIGVVPGKHRLRVEKEGFKFFAQDFEIEAGKDTPIKATLIPLEKPQPAAVAKVETPATVTTPQTPTTPVVSPTPSPSPVAPSVAAANSSSAPRRSPPLTLVPFDAGQAKTHQTVWAAHLGIPVETTNTIGMKLVLIPPGSFNIGSSAAQIVAAEKMGAEANNNARDLSRIHNEEGAHRATVSRPYLMAATEVTLGQFKQFIDATHYITEAEKFGSGNSSSTGGETDEKNKGLNWRGGSAATDDRPVTQVTWNDAVEFCQWLSEHEKLEACYRRDPKEGWVLALGAPKGYRLPAESQWEYACRAGTTSQYSFGDDIERLKDYAWHDRNSLGKSHPVATRQPNPFGLFDMHGNVWEWCHDWYGPYQEPDKMGGPPTGTKRVARGGSWIHPALLARSAFRTDPYPVHRDNNISFRPIRVLDPMPPAPAVVAAMPTLPVQPAPATTPAPKAAINPLVFNPAVERMAAQWVLKVSGSVWIRVGGNEPTQFQGSGSLPPGNWSITKILVPGRGQIDVRDADLAQLRGLSALLELDLGSINVTDQGLEHLQGLVTLESLTLWGVALQGDGLTNLSGMNRLKSFAIFTNRLSDSAMSRFPSLESLTSMTVRAGIKSLTFVRGCKNLTFLNVSNSGVSDLAPLAGLTNLKSLTISRASVKDDQLQHVRTLSGLNTLKLPLTQISDNGLKQLEGMTNLEEINLHDSKVSLYGVGKLQAALPNCKISLEPLVELTPSKRPAPVASTTATAAPTQPFDPAIERRVAEWALNSGGSVKQIVNGSRYGFTTRIDSLSPTPFQLYYVYLPERKNLNDADLAQLRGLSAIEELRLPGSLLTDVGLAHLERLTTLRQLSLGRTQATPAGMARLKSALPNCNIDVGASGLAALPALAPVVPPATVRTNDPPGFTRPAGAPPPAERLAVPPSTNQEKSMELVKDVFKDDYAKLKQPEEKLALAGKLFQQAVKSLDDPTGQYVMLREALRLAIEAGDATALEKSATALTSNFDLNEFDLLADSYDELLNKTRPIAVNKAVAESALVAIDRAVEAEEFTKAARFGKIALEAARKGKDNAQVKQVTDREKALATEKQQWETLSKAATTLAENPDDPAANLLMGKHLCFVAEDWEQGLPMLAKGSDSTLKELATKSLANPTEATGRLELGDAWWNATEKAKGAAKTELQTGAAHFYKQVLPLLTGLQKTRIERRLAEIPAALLGTKKRTSFTPKVRQPTSNSPTSSTTPAPAGTGKNLVGTVPIAKHFLQLGGIVFIKSGDKPDVQIKPSDPLPDEDFAIIGITLSNNKVVTDVDMTALRGLTALRKLYLNGTNISDAGLASLAGLTALADLNLSNMPQLTDLATTHLSKITSLKHLVLNDAAISDAGLNELRTLTAMDNLNLAGTKITGLGFANVTGFKNLTNLGVANTPFGDQGMAYVRQIASLQGLDLSRTQVTDAGMSGLKDLKDLTNIHLNQTNTSDVALGYLQGASKLQRMHVGSNATDAGMAALQKILPKCKIER